MAATAAATFANTVNNYFFVATILHVTFDLTLAQEHRFRINVFEDYAQQPVNRYENYRDDRYRDRHEEPYRQPYREHYQEPYREPYQQTYQQSYQQSYREPYTDTNRESYRQPYQQRLEPVSEKIPESKKKSKNDQDFSKIPGVPGLDYPIYHTVPVTSFSCSKVPYLPGMYANVEAGCQAYHTCHDGREGDQGASFLCSNGTLFNQNEFACDWWYNVDCSDALKLYKLNGDATTNPFVPKAKKDEILRDRLKIVVF